MEFIELLQKEFVRAKQLHPMYNSAHEAYAVILEELDEFKEQVWKKQKNRSDEKMLEELVQIAATAMKAAYSLQLLKGEDNEVINKCNNLYNVD
jgi:hypothetical protein